MLKICSIIGLCILSLFVHGQQFHFKQYSLKEGLSRSGVYDILQDDDGFLWIATEGGGLCKFDGNEFKTYTRFNGLPSEKIRVIFQDDQGLLWLGTTNGLAYFDGAEFNNLDVDDGISDSFIRSIAQDNEGDIWIGTNRGITVLDPEKKDPSGQLKINFSLPHKKVRALLAQDDVMWIGTDAGLCKYTQHNITVITSDSSLSDNTVLCLFNDSKGQLWVGTENGLNLVSDTSITSWTTENGLIANRVRSITEDHLGNIWIGTSYGISVFNGQTFLNLNGENGLPNDRVRCLTVDNFHNVWIGTYFGGIMRFNHQDFIAYTPQEGLVSSQIFSIAEDEKGDIIAGTYDGVSKLKIYNDKLVRCKTVTTKNGLRDNSVKAILKDTASYYWYGTNKGITLTKGNRIVYVDKYNGLKNESITVIKQFGETFWVGTENGLAKIKTNDYTHFDVEFLQIQDGLAGEIVSQIVQDQDGVVWVSFSDGGLTLFEKNRTVNLVLPDDIREISSIDFAPDGRLWVGTNGNGLFYGDYNAADHSLELENLSTLDDLSSNYIFSLLLYQNAVWVGHENGLDLITPQSDSTFTIQSYGPERGFLGLQNNPNASYADKKGNLWFGTVNGLFCLKSSLLSHFTEGKPSVNYIQSIKVNEKFIDWKTSEWCSGQTGVYGLPTDLKLPYDQNNISFEFIALNYISPEKVKYSWKLEGLDEDWKTESQKTGMTYTNLFPGKYVFKLRSSNEHGIITGPPVSFKFSIGKPWWSTWAVRIGFILLSIGLISIIISLRTRQLRRKQRSLEKTIQDRTTEIRLQKEELEVKNYEITDSILYSRRIQRSILPGKETLNLALSDYFIFYQPKDIVSGDFYWVERSPTNPNQLFLAVADCTGHGVPGAMVSLVGTRALNSSIKEKKLENPNTILNTTNQIVQEAFTDNESGSIVKDGMDIALCALDYSEGIVRFQFSGAHNPVWIVRPSSSPHLIINNTTLAPNLEIEGYCLYEIKGNKQPIGYFEHQTDFKNHAGILQKGDRIYMTSDGYADQFGGPNGKKFKYKALKALLLSVQSFSVSDQRRVVKRTFFDWKGDLEQLDDVCIMGIQV